MQKKITEKKLKTARNFNTSSFTVLGEAKDVLQLCRNISADTKKSSILSLNSSRLCRALTPHQRSHSNYLVPLCQKTGQNNKSTAAESWLESEESKTRAVAVVHAESPGSHIISVQISICHSRSETLVRPVLPHPADPDAKLQMQLFHYFPPPRCSSAATPVTLMRVAKRGRQASYSQRSFKESGKPRQLVCAFLPPS